MAALKKPGLKKTAKIVVYHKDPDGIGELISELGLSEKKADKYFEYGEYGTFEIEVDSEMNIVGGRVLPRGGK